jgi:hypothetical protein
MSDGDNRGRAHQSCADFLRISLNPAPLCQARHMKEQYPILNLEFDRVGG